MGEVVGYLRVSTDDQTTEAQKYAISERYSVDRWFSDDAVSGSVRSSVREGFSKLLSYVREGDTVVVYAIDRLGRNTVDVLDTVEKLHEEGVSVVSLREGFELNSPIGKAMLTMLAAVAELERSNIKARQMAGIVRARAKGMKLGRKKVVDDMEVAMWRSVHEESIANTAKHFGVSTSTVKRAWRRALASK